MTYVVPQVLVFQEFNLLAQAAVPEMAAHIAGGHAYLQRYTDADEKEGGYLGYYDRVVDRAYAWPGKPVGSKIDTSYTKVFIEDALLLYYSDPISAGSLIQTVSGYSNRVHSDSVSFADNGADYPHSTGLGDRGAKVGDIVKVTAVVGGKTYTLWTYITGFVGDPVAATVDTTPDSDPNNAATQSAPTPTSTQIAGPENCVSVTGVNSSQYDGLEDGDINETYTVEVIQSSVNGDATTARLRVTSASGRDNVDSVQPAAFGSPTAIGTRGLTVTWDNLGNAACSLSASNDGVSPDDFVVGQKWQITCGQAFTAPVATGGGTYTGAEDAIYIVEVTKGGTWSKSPQISVRTNKGTDLSGPTVVTGSGVQVPAGTYGVTISFSGAGLRKGDKYYIAVTAQKEGPYRTLILGHSLDPQVVAAHPVELGVELYIRKAVLEVPQNRWHEPPNQNWQQSDTELTVKSGLSVYAVEDGWTVNGAAAALPVYSEPSMDYGRLYVHYRAWRSDLSTSVEGINDIGQLDSYISGPLHPDNPLKWGVFKALSNSNGSPVMFTSVSDPDDPAQWTPVLELLTGREDVYGLVPLTQNRTVYDAYVAHVLSQSSAEAGRWRVCWLNASAPSQKAVVSRATSTDGNDVLATIADDPNTTGEQYTLLSVPARNSNFITNGVRPGDKVRILYVSDGFGGSSYSEYTVDAVLTQDSLRLKSGPPSAITVAEKMEVWRTLSGNDLAQEVVASSTFGHRRVRYVWPDQVGDGGLVYPGYHLCAALAGLASGIAPHQGMTNLQVQGFDNLDRTVQTFNSMQLNALASAGVWIVTKHPKTGDVYTRHALTAGDYNNLNEREEVVVRNVDSISMFLLSLMVPFIGRSNATDATLQNIASALTAGISELTGRNFTPRLGTQLVSGEITDLRVHALLRDRIVAALRLVIPYPANAIEIHLVI